MICQKSSCAWVLSETPKASLHLCKLLIINHYKRSLMAVGWKMTRQNPIFPPHSASIPLPSRFLSFFRQRCCFSGHRKQNRGMDTRRAFCRRAGPDQGYDLRVKEKTLQVRLTPFLKRFHQAVPRWSSQRSSAGWNSLPE